MKFAPALIVLLAACLLLGNHTPVVQAASPFYVIEAAYPHWRQYTFPPENLPLSLLTRVSHVFILPGKSGALDVPPGFLSPELVDRVHTADRIILLGVGGANSDKAFRDVLSNPQVRVVFVQNLTEFVLENGYDGLEIDWEFPANSVDRQNLNQFMAELNASLQNTAMDLQLTLVVTSNDTRGQWIDVDTITPLVDHYLVMTFTYHSASSSYSGHNTPMVPPSFEPDSMCVTGSIDYWVRTRGVPPSKVLLALATFGIGFNSESLYRSFTQYEQSDYKDITPLQALGYTRSWDDISQVPYLTQNQGPWLWSFDDPQSIGIKSEFIRQQGLAGAAIWDVTGDRIDSRHELIQTVAEKLTMYTAFIPQVRNFSSVPSPSDQIRISDDW